MAVYIPYNVPSLKNGKGVGKNGTLFKSKTVSHYLQKIGVADYSSSKKTYRNYKDPNRPNLIEQIKPELEEQIKKKEFPIKLGMYFVRDSKRSFDYINAAQIILDLMTAHGIIPDDSAEYVTPVFHGYSVEQGKAGVYLNIID